MLLSKSFFILIIFLQYILIDCVVQFIRYKADKTNENSENKPTRSLIIIIDITASMNNRFKELSSDKFIKVIDSGLRTKKYKDVKLVTFDKYSSKTLVKTTDAKELKKRLSELKTGYFDYAICQENSFSGINEAIQGGDVGSRVFLFTDAYPNNLHMEYSIRKAVKMNEIDFTTIKLLTDNCYEDHGNKFEQSDFSYHELAKISSGEMIASPDIQTILPYLQEKILNQKVRIVHQDILSAEAEFSISVNKDDKLTFSASGDETFLQINADIDKIVWTKNIKVVKLKNSSNDGNYKVKIATKGHCTFAVYSTYSFPTNLSTKIHHHPANLILLSVSIVIAIYF